MKPKNNSRPNPQSNSFVKKDTTKILCKIRVVLVKVYIYCTQAFPWACTSWWEKLASRFCFWLGSACGISWYMDYLIQNEPYLSNKLIGDLVTWSANNLPEPVGGTTFLPVGALGMRWTICSYYVIKHTIVSNNLLHTRVQKYPVASVRLWNLRTGICCTKWLWPQPMHFVFKFIITI